MDEQDILEGDFRVTALADAGQYIFEWVNKEQRTVTFLDDESDFDEPSGEVKSALQGQGIQLLNDEEAAEAESSDNTEDVSIAEPEGVSLSEPDGVSVERANDAEQNDAEPTPTTDTETSPEPEVEEEPGTDSEAEPEETKEEKIRTTEPTTSETASDQSDAASDDFPKEVTFTAEISDAAEKSDEIDRIEQFDKSAAAKLRSGGPYEVTYAVTADGDVSLIEVEDIVLDTSTEDE